MKGFEVAETISKFSASVYKSLAGICSIDEIPNTIPFHNFLLVNLSPAKDSQGTHWIVSNEIALCFCQWEFEQNLCNFLQVLSNQGVKNIEVFDPLGLRTNKKLFEKYLPFKSIDINDYNVQDMKSSTCGQFCIYFICMRFFNEDLNFEFFMQMFFQEDNVQKNEEVVAQFVNSI